MVSEHQTGTDVDMTENYFLFVFRLKWNRRFHYAVKYMCMTFKNIRLWAFFSRAMFILYEEAIFESQIYMCFNVAMP